MTDAELQVIESAAAELAQEAGELLMRYFQGPLEIDYKSENQRNPVTDADKAADEYIRGEIARRFPEHGIVSEETEDTAPDREAGTVWVIDPLDGTSNFLNGLPTFGVSIGVLDDGVPVAGAIYVPSIHNSGPGGGHLLHARAGGGAFEGSRPLSLAKGRKPVDSRVLAAMPTYFVRMFRFGPKVRRRLGDVRSTGSVAFELTMAARGVFTYVVFAGPFIWDVAAGVLLVQEAGGSVMTRQPGKRRWAPFERFTVKQRGERATLGELRLWRGGLVAGSPEAVEFIAGGLSFRRFRLRRTWRALKALLRRRRASGEQAAPPPKPGPGSTDGASAQAAQAGDTAGVTDGAPQSQDQGTSRRE